MNILVIPTTDWTKHPVPNRLNFIFDILAETHDVHIVDFRLKKFENQTARSTKCHLHNVTSIDIDDPSLYYIFNSFSHLLKMRNIIKKEKIDVIVSANILPAFLINFVRSDVPVVVDYLDHFEESASVYYPKSILGRVIKRGVRLIVRYNLKKADYVITVTNEFEKFLNSIGANRVNVIPNGVDTTVFRKIPTEIAKREIGLEGNVIGYIGSLEYWVDLETVIEALPELDVNLLVVGPGLFTDYGKMIKELAQCRGVLNKIVFTGGIEYAELFRYISAMDIGINPLKRLKKNEITVGGKIFNYMACGKPVLSSRMIALENLLGDDLFYYDDKSSFIEMIHKILNQKHDESRSIQIAKDFDWRVIANAYERTLQNVCKGYSSSQSCD